MGVGEKEAPLSSQKVTRRHLKESIRRTSFYAL